MGRTVGIDIGRQTLPVVSLEDLIARAARLLLDLAEGIPVPAKHARDYIRFVGHVAPHRMEAVWSDHRKPAQPTSFQGAIAVLKKLIRASADLLIAPVYSQDPHAHCPFCVSTDAFPLADPNAVLSLLGYC